MSGWGEKTIHKGSLTVFVPEQVELTDPTVRRRNCKDYQIALPELEAFNLQPYLYFISLHAGRRIEVAYSSGGTTF